MTDTGVHRLLVSWTFAGALLGPGCNAAFGQAVGEQERMRVEMHAEKTFTMRFETTPRHEYCQARVSLRYTQRSHVASVSGVIESGDCEAAGGSYTVSIRYRDQDGEVRNLRVEHDWQRDDAGPVTFERDYEIGENADLIGVNARKIDCICAAAPPGDEPADTPAKGEQK